MRNLFATSLLLTQLIPEGSAQKIPAFDPQKVSIAIPAYLPGIMDDGSAVLRNDTLFYSLQGQVFPKGTPLRSARRFPKPANPWEAVYEIATAYSLGDRKAILSLYDTKTRPMVDSLLQSKDAGVFLGTVRKATVSDLRLMGGFSYRDGFLAVSRDTSFGPHLNYIVREGETYRLSSLEDDAATSWNLGMFYKYQPGPRIDIDSLGLPDSLRFRDALHIRVDLKARGRWVTVCPTTPNSQILHQAQDNGMNDLDPAVGKVWISINTGRFMSPGEYSFHVVSLTHPVDRVSETFLKGRSYRIILKP